MANKEVKNKALDENLTDGTVFSSDYDGEIGSSKTAKKAERKSSNKKNNDDKNKKKINKTIIAIIAAVLVIGILVGVYFLVSNMQEISDEDAVTSMYPTDANGEQYAVDSKGNKIDSAKDANGNIISAGEITLTDESVFDIKSISVTNENGQFEINAHAPVEKVTNADGEESEETQQMEYTLVGFEDANLEGTGLSTVASAISSISTKQIIDINGENPKDYGLEEPRAAVKANYTEKTVTLYVGNDAAGGIGTYIKFGEDKAIYLVETSTVEAFFFNPLAIMSTSVTNSATDEEANTPQTFTISGSNFKEELVFEPNDDETNAATYKMVSPQERPANVTKGSGVIGSVRSLNADSVLAYKPSKAQLEKFGLYAPYAKVVAKYADATYTLSASKPDSDGNVNLYSAENDMVYLIASSRVSWVTTSFDEMVYEYVLMPSKAFVKSIDIEAGSKKYTFTLSEVTTKDDSGNEITQTEATCGTTKIEAAYFDTFYENLTSVLRNGEYDETADKTKAPAFKVTYNYNNGKKSETVEYYQGESRKYLEVLNGTDDSFVYDTYISKMIEDVETISKNKAVKAM